MRVLFVFLTISIHFISSAQLRWQNVDSAYTPLPSSVHVYFSEEAIDTAPFRAFYVIADLKDKHLDFTTDTTANRRITLQKFFERNGSPLIVVNGTFFSYETNRSLNVVIKNGELLYFNSKTIKGKGADSLINIPVYSSAIGITKKRKADVAWIKTDSIVGKVWASQYPNPGVGKFFRTNKATGQTSFIDMNIWEKWKMETAIGGGPVLIYRDSIYITNEFEHMFTGKAINDKHPRTAMGYTADNKLIILMVEGRNKVAHGATLLQEAQILKDLGCVEALNLDGGGSSCLLVNGKETIKPSDAVGQRPVPAVFIIKNKK